MSPRDTTTGSVLEQMVLPALSKGGYVYEKQVNIGNRLGGGKHYIDIVAKNKVGDQILISLKWQQVSGTAEQKVPFEVMCLTEIISSKNDIYKKSYVVLGGNGWKLKDFYTSGGLSKYLKDDTCVTLIGLEDFVFKANRGNL